MEFVDCSIITLTISWFYEYYLLALSFPTSIVQNTDKLRDLMVRMVKIIYPKYYIQKMLGLNVRYHNVIKHFVAGIYST